MCRKRFFASPQKPVVSNYEWPPWQPMATAPKDGTQILTCIRGNFVPVWWQQTTFWNGISWENYPPGIDPLWWMELPTPPGAISREEWEHQVPADDVRRVLISDAVRGSKKR